MKKLLQNRPTHYSAGSLPSQEGQQVGTQPHRIVKVRVTVDGDTVHTATARVQDLTSRAYSGQAFVTRVGPLIAGRKTGLAFCLDGEDGKNAATAVRCTKGQVIVWRLVDHQSDYISRSFRE